MTQLTINSAEMERVSHNLTLMTVVARDEACEPFKLELFAEHPDKKIEAKDRVAIQTLLEACGADGANDTLELIGTTIHRVAWFTVARMIEYRKEKVLPKPRAAAPAARQAPEPDGRYVYVISCTDSDFPLCKIGIASSPEKSLKALATASPHTLRIEMTRHTPFARGIESAAHVHFSEYRRNGEWFGMPVQTAIDYVHEQIRKAA